MKRLTPKEKLFVESYLSNNFNATKAYYSSYKVKKDGDWVRRSAYEVKNREHVAQEIQRRLEEMVGSKEEISNRMLKRLMEMAFADKSDEDWGANTSIRAIELLQKQLGLNMTNINETAEIEVNIIGDNNET